jgi:cytochrome c553
LQCEACHGATHAEYPTSQPNDNLLSMDVQGHEGTISECVACHKTVQVTANGGPHGIHTIGQDWVDGHKSYAKNDTTACAYCHGTNFQGTPLSKTKAVRSFTVDDGGTKSYAAGQIVTCYDCHNGPNGG